ncbi:thiamine-phosphate kinase [Euzebya tangerina]|uniref:thiamine-phosphate kinase n=1 Tax=Euzebya tangerina TaxID=591198 RepID=UPI0013C2C6B2|nr:thiamine-phosphate kinase [Euzebya tangerina]
MTPVGEFSRLAALTPHLAKTSARVPVGVGDDAAVVRVGETDVVICVDTIVEGVHVDRDVSSPEDIGWKSMAVNLSDIAAMGAVPRAAVVGLNRPSTLDEDDIEALYRGMAQAAARHDFEVVGGDTVTSTEWSISVTMLGEMPADTAPVTRGGAAAGDIVILVGEIGAGAAALWAREHEQTPWTHHLSRHRRPRPLVRTGPVLAGLGVTAMIDISDGVGIDARHICDASDVSMNLIAEALAVAVAPGVADVVGEGWLTTAVGGGEDFALLATVPSGQWATLKEEVAATGEAVAHRIGVVGPPPAEGEPRVLLEGSGDLSTPIDTLGYDHG